MSNVFSGGDLQAMLDECHGAFGVPVTITSVAEGAFNTSTGVRATTTTVVDTDAIRSERTTQDLGGTAVREVTFALRQSELSFIPKPGDTINDGTETHRVSQVDVLVATLEYHLRCRTNRQD